jgi:hypothetical protein
MQRQSPQGRPRAAKAAEARHELTVERRGRREAWRKRGAIRVSPGCCRTVVGRQLK